MTEVTIVLKDISPSCISNDDGDKIFNIVDDIIADNKVIIDCIDIIAMNSYKK